MKKKPKSKKNIEYKKEPRIQDSNMSFNQRNPSWKFSVIDLDFVGDWGWTNISTINEIKEIKKKISDFESMTWHQILNTKNNHEVNIASLCKKAQKRLKELKLDDIESLISLRLSGKKRVWGIKNENVCKILWWDPNHKVCPSLLKHT